MKKFLTLALTAVMALSLLTACGSKNDNSADANTDGSNTETTLSGTVSTDGSTSMEKVINSLGESFMAMNKDMKFTYNPTDSNSDILFFFFITPPARAPAFRPLAKAAATSAFRAARSRMTKRPPALLRPSSRSTASPLS